MRSPASGLLRTSTTLDDESFVVERIDDQGLRFLALSSNGASALILATSAETLPFRRRWLVSVLTTALIVSSWNTERNANSEHRWSRPALNEQATDDLFATLCASLADAVPLAATDHDVAVEIDRWARLFWRHEGQPAKADLIGLAGELVCIADSNDVNRWVQAWHPRPEDRFDFTFLPGPGVVEVKSTAKDRRVRIALTQVDGPHLDSRFVASVRIVDGSTSLGDVVRSIADGLSDDASLLALWNVLTLTCGAGLDDALALRIDFELARTSIRYYRASSIPRPCRATAASGRSCQHQVFRLTSISAKQSTVTRSNRCCTTCDTLILAPQGDSQDRRLKAVEVLACAERLAATLKQILGVFADGLVIERTNAIRCGPALVAVAFEGDHEFCVTEDRHVGVVGANEYLTGPLQLAKTRHDAVVHEAVVEVVFWLVDDKRARRGSKREEERGCALTLR